MFIEHLEQSIDRQKYIVENKIEERESKSEKERNVTAVWGKTNCVDSGHVRFRSFLVFFFFLFAVEGLCNKAKNEKWEEGEKAL